MGALRAGDRLPSVRGLASDLGLSPSTIAAVYRDLRQRGVLVSHDRSRTVVAHRRQVATRLTPNLPPGCRDLSSGNPDTALLPDLAPALRTVVPDEGRYGASGNHPALLDLARARFAADDIDPSSLAVVSSGLDGIERVLTLHCRAGDRVAVEDPGYVGSLDLIRSLGLEPVPVAIDQEGLDPDALAEALELGVEALIVVPRAQNPTGAVLSDERAAALRGLLDDHAEVVVIEDDHLAPLSPDPPATLTTDRSRWAVVRSLAKSLGPDLRVAVVAGDETTMTDVAGRQRLGPGWVSRLLQQVAATTWRTAEEDGTLATAADTYAARREALLVALGEADVVATGRSGWNVWVPVDEEVPVVQGLVARGWAVQAGEAFRLRSEPGIRITVAGLPCPDVDGFVDDLLVVLGRRMPTRRG